MKLTELLAGLTPVVADVEITGIALDSRQVKPGFLFIALAGAVRHGIEHARQAIADGAAAILYEPANGGMEGAEMLALENKLAVPGLAAKLGEISARFYREPSRSLNVVGVTGTNGKTSCSQFLAQVLPDCGVIGTLGWGSWGLLRQTVNTTPDAVSTQSMLKALLDQGKRNVAMEVSSHGLEQGRVNSVRFKGALFTNLSRDHLDYHGSMEEYLKAKTRLFRHPGLEFAVINLDDAYAQEIIGQIDPAVKIWGFGKAAIDKPVMEYVRAENVEYGVEGIRFDACWRDRKVFVDTRVAGVFNLENLLAVMAVLLAMGESLTQSAKKLETLQPVMGRMEHFGGHNQPTVFVDYAHSPDALDKVLSGLASHRRNKLSVIFGCGGDRDKGKRVQMREIAEKWADDVVVTDDNPRTEAPEAIVADILEGCQSDKVTVIHDRMQAIRTVIGRADLNDCIVVAGKGHEHYQEINGERLPFSDQEEVRQALTTWREKR